MGTTHERPLCDELRDRNDRLDDQLRSRIGISVGTYKFASFVLRVVGVALIVGPYYLPSVEPLSQTATLVVAGLILGPDAVEAYLTRET